MARIAKTKRGNAAAEVAATAEVAKKKRPKPDVPAACFSIPEFCVAYRISEAHYFAMKAAGIGPREAHAMNKVLISFEAAAEWLARCEAGEIVAPKKPKTPVLLSEPSP